MFAIAAMSRNRVIGNGGGIPWRIADEHRWFRRMTMHGMVIMGRKTFESLPGPLDGRINVVLTRNPLQFLEDEQRKGRLRDAVVESAAHRVPDLVQLTFPRLRTEVRLVRSIDFLVRAGATREPAWLCGGAQLYTQFLPFCSELFLTIVDREVEGDASFPRFEHLFDLDATVHEAAEFHVLHYRRNAAQPQPELAEGTVEAAPRVRPVPPEP